MYFLVGLKYGAIPLISLHNIVTPLVELGCDYFLLVVSTQPNIFIHKQNNHSIPQYITTSLLAHFPHLSVIIEIQSQLFAQNRQQCTVLVSQVTVFMTFLIIVTLQSASTKNTYCYILAWNNIFRLFKKPWRHGKKYYLKRYGCKLK